MPRDIHTWPYDGPDGMVENYRMGNPRWTETTEEVWWNQLEAVPPIRMQGRAFMVGECFSRDTYAAFIQVGDRFFGRMDRLKDFDPARYMQEIRLQLRHPEPPARDLIWLLVRMITDSERVVRNQRTFQLDGAGRLAFALESVADEFTKYLGHIFLKEEIVEYGKYVQDFSIEPQEV